MRGFFYSFSIAVVKMEINSPTIVKRFGQARIILPFPLRTWEKTMAKSQIIREKFLIFFKLIFSKLQTALIYLD